MLLSSVSTIIMCSNEVSSLLKADVNLADTANCHSPPVHVCVRLNECVYKCVCVCLCVCVCILKTHSRQKSQSKPEVIQYNSRPSVSARRNDRRSSDKLFLCLWSLGQHSSFSTSICDPCLPFLNILPSSRCTFYPLPNVPAPHPCSSAVGSACRGCVAAFQMYPQGLLKQQMGITVSVSVLSSINEIMWWCDTQGTTKGKTDLISFPYKSPPLFRLCKSGEKKKKKQMPKQFNVEFVKN